MRVPRMLEVRHSRECRWDDAVTLTAPSACSFVEALLRRTCNLNFGGHVWRWPDRTFFFVALTF